MSSTQPNHVKDLVPGDHLSSPSSKYLLKSFLGQGSFGKVARCVRLKDRTTVALKMMNNISQSLKNANHEVSIMVKLKSLDPDKCNIIRWHEIFVDRGRICLEFEHLDKSLFDFMKDRYFRPLLLKEIRPIVQQLANALNHLKAIEIIHGDVKLENVMLVHQERNPYRVKLIDFGCASKKSDAKPCSYIQTRPYRSPEVILGLPFNEAIDMWSLGCLAASLYLGALLYPGVNEHDMIRLIMRTQGPLPNEMLSHGRKTSLFFHREHNSTTTSWKLKELQLNDLQKRKRKVDLTSLDELAKSRVIKYDSYPEKLAQSTDVLMFVDMLKGMLQLDAAKRITPSQALEHGFISISHIAHLQSLSPYVRSCFSIMAAHPIQQKSLCPPAKSSDLSQPKDNSHPSTSSQTNYSNKSGTKRYFHDEDGKACKASQPHKSVKSTHNGQSASYSNSQAQSCISPSVKRKRTHEEPDHKEKRFKDSSSEYHSKMRPPNRIQFEKPCTRPGEKRKARSDDDEEDVQPRKKPPV